MAAVGHPRLEAMLLSRHNTHKDRANDVGTSSGRHRVVFLGTNGVEADDTAAIELVAEAFQHDASIDLRFLPHPNEPRTKYERLVSSRLIEPDQVVTGGSTYQQVLEAALVLGTQTTMLPESLALGIPVIQVLPERFSVDWQRQGMATASDVDSLQTAARAVLSDPDVKKHLLVNSSALVERMFGDSHGVTDRIIEHVEAELRRVRTT
jgi:predicted glycosyltransferase